MMDLRWHFKNLWWNSWFYRVYYRARFILTGDCGHGGCGCVWLTDAETSVRYYQFVPQANCPVHDTKYYG